MYYDGNDENERMMRQRMRQLRHDLEHAERERAHAIRDEIKEAAHAQRDMWKNAVKHGAYPMGGTYAYSYGGSSPRSVEQILEEIDSYISYLEDLPKEKVAPYEEKLDKAGEHLKSLKDSLKKQGT